MILVTGGSGYGKSSFAEDRIYEMREILKLPVYYIATMMVYGKEEEKIVARHKKLREGKGFIAIEQPTDLEQCFDKMEEHAIALLECNSNLVANEMFATGVELDEETVYKKVSEELKALRDRVDEMVVVTSDTSEAGDDYSETTLAYIKALSRVNRDLAAMADEVYELVVGIPVRVK